MIKVSVIIPVYNGEGHLTECMDSICGQTLQDIEIICVDDGSTDQSMQILQEYQDQDSRIKIYQQDHKYAGVARNLGMSHATGEYLAFWDCDDFFELNALEELYNKATSLDADICVCGGNRYFEDTKLFDPDVRGYLNLKRIPHGKDVFNRDTNENHIIDFTCVPAWNKLYKKKFIDSKQLNFKSTRNGNDVYFTISALCLAEKITYVNKPLVTYRKNREDSLVNNISKAPISLFNTWSETAEYLKQMGIFPERSFVNEEIMEIIYSLRHITEFQSFVQAVQFLQDGNLERMNIKEAREETFYNSRWYGEFVDHLVKDSPEDLLIFLSKRNYSQLVEANVKKKIANLRRDDVLNKNKEQKKVIDELKTKLSSTENNNIKMGKELKNIRNSWTFKAGKFVMWIPSHLKAFFQRMGS